MNWYVCDGGCADIKEMCCHPVAEVTETVVMDCEGEADPKSVRFCIRMYGFFVYLHSLVCKVVW